MLYPNLTVIDESSFYVNSDKRHGYRVFCSLKTQKNIFYIIYNTIYFHDPYDLQIKAVRVDTPAEYCSAAVLLTVDKIDYALMKNSTDVMSLKMSDVEENGLILKQYERVTNEWPMIQHFGRYVQIFYD
jgi:hypothetical protein